MSVLKNILKFSIAFKLISVVVLLSFIAMIFSIFVLDNYFYVIKLIYFDVYFVLSILFFWLIFRIINHIFSNKK